MSLGLSLNTVALRSLNFEKHYLQRLIDILLSIVTRKPITIYGWRKLCLTGV